MDPLKELHARLIELQRSKNHLVFALADDEMGGNPLSVSQRASARETVSMLEDEISQVRALIRAHMSEYSGS